MGKNPGASNCRELLPPLGVKGMVANPRESSYLKRVAGEQSQSTATPQRVSQGSYFYSRPLMFYRYLFIQFWDIYSEQCLRRALTFIEAGFFMHCSEPPWDPLSKTAIKLTEKAFIRVCYLPGPASDSIHTFMSHLVIPFGKFLSETCFEHAALL